MKTYKPQHRISMAAILLLFCCLHTSNATLSAHVADAVFAIQPDNVKYLRYLRYENTFDTATVSYTFGEIRLMYNGQVQKIPLSTFSGELKAITGAMTQGEDATLLPLGTSTTFTIPSDHPAEVAFYREMAGYVPCGTLRPGEPGGGSGTWEDNHWAVGAGRIPDVTEWVLHIVRASDDKVVGTLDSVGVRPNPSTIFANYYGTTPGRMNHVRTIPSGLAGTTVYLRVSPRRYGPTPLGMALNKMTSWVSFSTLFEYTPTARTLCTDEDIAYIQDKYFSELLSFTDSTMLATGTTPNLYFTTHNKAQSAIYRQRYMIDTVINNTPRIFEKDSLTFASEYWSTPLVKSSAGEAHNRLGSSLYIGSITPNPVAGSAVAVSFAGPFPTSRCTLELYAADGRKVGELWSGIASAQPLDINLGRLEHGTYFLVLCNANGLRVDARKMMVGR